MKKGLPSQNNIPMKDALKKYNISYSTMISYLTSFEVNGHPIGVKIGGRWKINTDQLEAFLNGQGELIEEAG